MKDNPLNIAFLWHFHQPNYKDPLTNRYRLPWVRLHGVKDYLDMVKKAEKFPSLKLTFNLVPSLLEQLNDYVENDAKDVYLLLTQKSPSDLTEAERLFILENFFLANWENMIKPYPRYYELLARRGFRFTKKDLFKVSRYFSDNDIRDLQVLFNLSWVDPTFRNADPFLYGLIEKGRDFTEDEKQELISKQLEILRDIIPVYKQITAQGQVEFSVSPFNHPILPLLYDTNVARIAMPDMVLPKKRFSHPEDAQRQIEMAISYFERLFGYLPSGIWPPEGSVSEDIAGIIKSKGIKWVATDEEVLSRSLSKTLRNANGYPIHPQILYKPYSYNGLSILFRDHILSDLIGFSYSGWNTENAVKDLISRLLEIKNALPYDRPYLVPIIVDGENAWEYYINDGNDFLDLLYDALTRDKRFRTVRITEFIEEHGQGDSLHYLYPGSWINANFSIWIGHEEDNLAWDYLAQAREDLAAYAASHPDADLSKAWEAIYVAEGSDWNWWYGDEHATETHDDFDELFRGYLIKVYEIIGCDIPHHLHIPIKIESRTIKPQIEPRGFINPKIDGLMTSYFEWLLGAFIDVKRSGGSMHKSESFVSGIYYGFNKDNLYIRVDPMKTSGETQGQIFFHINILHPFVFKLIFAPLSKSNQAALYEKVDEQWVMVKDSLRAAFKDILEIEIPFADIKVKENDEIHFCVDVILNGTNGALPGDYPAKRADTLERCPWRGYITVTVPASHFEALMWY
jgi:alpha-amylase/alpha-mannosidase (GH57 family)